MLVPGGRAVVMLYNRHSLRRCAMQRCATNRGRRDGASLEDELRGIYDATIRARRRRTPTSSRKHEVRQLFRDFARVKIDVQNFDGYGSASSANGSSNLARVVGLDLYIVADKHF